MFILCINVNIAVKKIGITMPYNRIVQQIIRQKILTEMLLITTFTAIFSRVHLSLDAKKYPLTCTFYTVNVLTVFEEVVSYVMSTFKINIYNLQLSPWK
jgi:hypothetical protein